MGDNMKITKDTLTFAQSENDYILTNEKDLTFDNLNIKKHKGVLVNLDRKTISPYLSIGVLTKMIPDWVKPDRQLTAEELKDFRQLR